MDSAWRSLRFFSICSGVAPLPTTGSSQLKPMYQLDASTVVGSRMPLSWNSLPFLASSLACTIIVVPKSRRSIAGES